MQNVNISGYPGVDPTGATFSTDAVLAAWAAANAFGDSVEAQVLFDVNGNYKVAPLYGASQLLAVTSDGVGVAALRLSNVTIEQWARPATLGGAPRDPTGSIADGRGAFLQYQGQSNIWLNKLIVDGLCEVTTDAGNWGIPATGWDISHKCLKAHTPFDLLFVVDCILRRWRGETVYAGGDQNNGLIIIRRSLIEKCNASAVSATASLLMEDSTVQECYNGVESFLFGTQYHTLRRCVVQPNVSPITYMHNGVALLGQSGTSVLITDCLIKNAGSYGILFAEFAHNAVVKNTTFIDASGTVAGQTKAVCIMFQDLNDPNYASQRVGHEGFTDMVFENLTFVARTKSQQGFQFFNGGVARGENIVIDKATLINEGAYAMQALVNYNTTGKGPLGVWEVRNTVIPFNSKVATDQRADQTTRPPRLFNTAIKDPEYFDTYGTPPGTDVILPLKHSGRVRIRDVRYGGTPDPTITLTFGDPATYYAEIEPGFTKVVHFTKEGARFKPLPTDTPVDCVNGTILQYVWTGSAWVAPTPYDVILDGTPAALSLIGLWTTASASTYYNGATTVSDVGAIDPLKRATLPLSALPQPGYYRVYFHTREGASTSSGGTGIGTIRVNHAAGSTEWEHNWTLNRNGWITLGWFHFRGDGSDSVEIETTSNAKIDFDAIRVEFVALYKDDLTTIRLNPTQFGDSLDIVRLRVDAERHPLLNDVRWFERYMTQQVNRRVSMFYETLLRTTAEMDANGSPYYNFNNTYWPDRHWQALERLAVLAHNQLGQFVSHNTDLAVYGNATAKADIVRAVEWIVDNYIDPAAWDWAHAGTGTHNAWSGGSWFTLEISLPRTLAELRLTLNDSLSAATKTKIDNYLAIYRRDSTNILFYDNGGAGYPAYLANLAWIKECWFLVGLAQGNETMVANAVSELSNVFVAESSEDAAFADGGFIKGAVPSMHGYANGLANTLGQFARWTEGTAYTVPQSVLDGAEILVLGGIEPFLTPYGEVTQVAVSRGRAMKAAERLSTGLAANVAAIAPYLTPDGADAAMSFVKRVLYEKPYLFQSFDDTSLVKHSEAMQAAVIAADPDVSVANLGNRARSLSSVGMCLYRSSTFHLVVTGASNRIKPWETLYNYNIKPWYSNVGNVYLDIGIRQWQDDTMPTIDPYKMPGTTVSPTMPRNSPPAGGLYHANDWSGGANLDEDAVAYGLNYSANIVGEFSSTLVANKAVFVAEDMVVCIGNGITSTDAHPVMTIIDNLKLPQAADERFYLNGTEQVGWNGVLPTAVSMGPMTHVFVSNLDNDKSMGYVFPTPQPNNTVWVRREARTDTWWSISPKDTESNVPITRNFATLEWGHGTNPTDASYAYVMLPNRTKEEVDSFAANNPVTILRNDDVAMAVQIGSYTMAIVWQASGVSPVVLGDFTVDAPCSFVAKVSPNRIRFAVNSPNGDAPQVRVIFNGSTEAVEDLPPECEVISLDPLTVDCDLSADRYVTTWGTASQEVDPPSGNQAVVTRLGAGAHPSTGTPSNITIHSSIRVYSEQGPNLPTVPAPTGFSATAVAGPAVNLVWTDPASDEYGFELQRKTGTGSYGALFMPPSESESHVDDTVGAATDYTYRIRTVTPYGVSAWVESSEVTTPGSGSAPVAPSGLFIENTYATSVEIAWADNSSDETSFTVQRKIGAGGTWGNDVVLGPDTETWTFAPALPETEYYFRVRASNASGDSAWSNEASTTTLAASSNANIALIRGSAGNVAALVAYLTGEGHTVTEKAKTDTTWDPDTFDVVYIADDVSPQDMSWMADTTAGVVLMESSEYVELKLAGSGTYYGSTPGNYLGLDHFICSDMAGTEGVSDFTASASMGSLSLYSMLPLVQPTGDVEKIIVAAVPAGGACQGDGVAFAGRRVWCGFRTENSLTSLGRQVVEKCIQWAAGKAAPPTDTGSYRYMRMRITKKRAAGDKNLQLSRVVWREGITDRIPATCYAFGSGKTQADDEGAPKLIDGLTTTKLVDTHFCATTADVDGLSDLVFDFGYGNSYAIDEMQFYTANDATARDPISFTIHGSANGTDWVDLATFNNITLTTDRQAASPLFGWTVSS